MSIDQINSLVSAADRVVTTIENKAAEIDTKTAQLDNDYNQKKNALDQQVSENSAQLAIVASDGYRKAIEDASGGRNTVVIDEQGNPNVMVRIPRFNYEDLNDAILLKFGVDLKLGVGTPTMFKNNGEYYGEILIAKYLATTGLAGGCSVIGGTQPKTNLDYDTAKTICNNKGEGWHMMSIHEWSAIALWSLANGTLPRGNTDFGRSHNAKFETARRLDNAAPGGIESSGMARTDTGQGPKYWNHDHSEWGICDLNGNIWEWIDQMKLSEGQIITTLDNNPQLHEDNWFRHHAYFDSPQPLTEGSGSAGSPILNSQILNKNGPARDNDYQNPFMHNTVYSAIEKHQSYTPNELLRRLLIESEEQDVIPGGLWCRNYGERLPRRGGYWGDGGKAGLGALSVSGPRSDKNVHIGFRPALFL